MIPVMQTRFSNEEGTEHGNCFTACVASLLEVPIESVPDFSSMGHRWFPTFYRFLDSHGYEFFGSGTIKSHGIKSLEEFKGVDGYVIVGGKSPRTYVKRGHAVIYKNGKLVHDPHPSGEGLLEVEDWYFIERIPCEKENL